MGSVVNLEANQESRSESPYDYWYVGRIVPSSLMQAVGSASASDGSIHLRSQHVCELAAGKAYSAIHAI